MNVLLSLSLLLAVMMSSCCGDAGSYEDDSTSDYDYEATPTPAYDYDYTATFDYYFVTGLYPAAAEVHNKAAGIGRISPVLLLGMAIHQIWT